MKDPHPQRTFPAKAPTAVVEMRHLITVALAGALWCALLPRDAGAEEFPSMGLMDGWFDGTQQDIALSWHTPFFELPEERGFVDTWYDIRYGLEPITADNWATSLPIAANWPDVAIVRPGQIKFKMTVGPYNEYSGPVATTDKAHIRVWLSVEYKFHESIQPIERGIPGQEIWFRVCDGDSVIDWNQEDVYTTRPSGKAEWVSGDLTDEYWADGGKWLTCEAGWDGGTITLWNGQNVGAGAMSDSELTHFFEGYMYTPIPPPIEWHFCGGTYQYSLRGPEFVFDVPRSAIGDEYYEEESFPVEVTIPSDPPPPVGMRPGVSDIMLPFYVEQLSGPEITGFYESVETTVTYPEEMLYEGAPLGESSMRAYVYDEDLVEWVLIDEALTNLDRVHHALNFPIQRFGLYALAAETDGDEDGLGDFEETEYGMDPGVGDMDGDGVNDGDEIWFSLSDPLDLLKLTSEDQNGLGSLVEPEDGIYVAGRIHVGDEESPVSNNVYIGPQAFLSGQALEGVWKSDAQWADFDGDDDLDLAISGEDNGGVYVTMTYENQDGTLVLRQSDLPGVQCESSGHLAWGDYDNDGDLDLAIAGMDNTSAGLSRVYENDGAGNLTWDTAQILEPVTRASVAWGDYDNDGDSDLVLIGHDDTAQAVAILYQNDPLGTLTPDLNHALTGIRNGSADWADYDNDGDVDLVLTGYDGSSRRVIFYENDPIGTLNDTGDHGVSGVNLSDAAFGDYDNDGDVDLALTGELATGGPRCARVYENDGMGNFTQVADKESLYRSSCTWGDYDHDGDLDVAFCGYTGGSLSTTIYENTGSSFDAAFWFPGRYEGSLTWADVDLDGDLDFLVTGYDWVTAFAQIHENTGVSPNTPPSAPTMQDGAAEDEGLRLSWAGASDLKTPTTGLHYCVKVGTSFNGDDIMSGAYGTPLMGSVGQGSDVLLNVAHGTYYWRVRAVDAGLTASPWSANAICHYYSVDFDGNEVVNLDDYALFHDCLTGPGGGVDPGCEQMDLDGDVDVDLYDAAAFLAVFAG